MMLFTGTAEQWGLIPEFLDPHDERDAVTQLDANYQHGGGWHDTVTDYALVGGGTTPWELLFFVDSDSPPLIEKGRTMLRDEVIVLFQYDWVAVIQRDGSSRVARID